METKYTKLWELLKKANPEEKKQIINKLSDEDIIQLRYISNPYRLPPYKSSAKFLEFSLINSPRDYITNLVMTSMVGFIYKMALEFQYNSDKYIPEDTGNFALAMNAKLKEFNLSNFKQHYLNIFKKTGNKTDKAKYLRAKVVVLKKRYDMENNNKYVDEIKKAETKAINYCKSNQIPYESVFPQDIQISSDQINELKQEVKKELNIKYTQQDHNEKIQNYILDFLDEYFNFDPNNHIRCGYMPHYDEKLKNAKLKSVETPTGHEMLVTDKFEQYLIPPMDTFHSFKTYFDSNYEYLRECTDNIYGKTDFDFAVIAREVFNTKEKAEKWEAKYQNELDVSCYRIPFNEWVFMDPWEKNRSKVTFNDEKTKLISEILERKKQEEKLGKQLISKKVKKMKGRVKDKLPFNSQAEELGVERLSELDTNRNENDVEIKVYSTRLLRNRRGIKAESNNFSFDIPKEKPEINNSNN